MSNSNDITVLNSGVYKNLLAQVDAIYKHSNELNFKTRARYFEATKRFCKFLADNFRLQNFKNVDDRHFKAYVEHLKENNAAATIQSDLSGIRYFHRKSSSKNRLSQNKELNLPKRSTGKEDHSFLKIEIDGMRQLAIEQGRQDVVIAIDFACEFGLRLEEVCTLRVEYLMSALKTGQLVIKGKGGQTRAIDLSEEQREIVKKYIDYTDFIFVNRYGDVQHQGTLNKAIRRIIRDCNDEVLLKEEKDPVLLPPFSCHSLRHTFATRLCESGINVKVIQDVLGHADISTTMNIYCDVTNELKRKEFTSLGEFFKEKQI